MTIQHRTSESFESRTSSFSANPVVNSVRRIRELQADLTPRQRAAHQAEDDRVTALLATGAFARR